MAARGYAVAAVLIALSMPMLTGCVSAVAMGAMGARLATPDTVTQKAAFEFGGRSVVVIPFKDAARTYYESTDGLDLATAVQGELLSRKTAAKVVSDDGVRKQFAGQDLDRAGWQAVGRAAGAQLVLSGDILTFRLKDPNTIGMLRGYSNVNVTIFDVEKNCIVYAGRAIECYVPERGAGIVASDMDPDRLRGLLLSVSAMKIVQNFYTWEKLPGPEPSRY